jgi:UDP-N-acetylmuramoyl-L-alanyl-D-glutamate--2,6-diaminopimelate ligase
MVNGSDDVQINRLCDDSRNVEPGSLFVAVSGTQADGHAFIPSAIERGAAALVVEKAIGVPSSVPVVEVRDARMALAVLSHFMAGRPSDQLRIVGVTGTNGKTTTAWLIHHMLTHVGCETGLIGTIESKIGSKRVVATLTTPGPIELSNLLSDMVDAGCTDCVMEVSSHALAQHRVSGIRFSGAVFTNLTHDHLDYHRTWDNYLNAKKALFDGLESGAVAVYNADDPAGNRVVSDSSGMRYAYGRTAAAEFSFRILDSGLAGLRLEVDGEERSFNLVGGFNAYNLTAAYSLGRAFGYEKTVVLDALESARPVPGRLEQIQCLNGITAIVDYAHTPDALENVLHSVREISQPSTRMWCLFGCGGDRDRGKRPLMAEIAERLADRVIVTSDNPRTESPEAILDDIRAGMRRPEEAVWILDRREAIQYAGAHAASGDTVVLAGKGHEEYQVVGRERIHLDDHEEVRQWCT